MPKLVGRELLLARVLRRAEADNFGVVGDGREHHDRYADRDEQGTPRASRSLRRRSAGVRHRDLPRSSSD